MVEKVVTAASNVPQTCSQDGEWRHIFHPTNPAWQRRDRIETMRAILNDVPLLQSTLIDGKIVTRLFWKFSALKSSSAARRRWYCYITVAGNHSAGLRPVSEDRNRFQVVQKANGTWKSDGCDHFRILKPQHIPGYYAPEDDTQLWCYVLTKCHFDTAATLASIVFLLVRYPRKLGARP